MGKKPKEYYRKQKSKVIAFENNVTIEEWELLMDKGRNIDDYYYSNTDLVLENLAEVNRVIDDHCISKRKISLSLYEWNKLHIDVHSEVIKYKDLVKSNVELKTKYSQLVLELKSLKNTLVENYTDVTYFKTSYS